MEQEMAYWAAIAVVAIGCLLVAVKSASTARRLTEEKEQLASRVSALEEELSALMDGTFGMGDQLNQLRQDLKSAIETQQRLDQRDLGSLPYEQAVRLAGQGESADELVRQCGLSRSEAELVLLLHQQTPSIDDQ